MPRGRAERETGIDAISGAPALSTDCVGRRWVLPSLTYFLATLTEA